MNYYSEEIIIGLLGIAAFIVFDIIWKRKTRSAKNQGRKGRLKGLAFFLLVFLAWLGVMRVFAIFQHRKMLSHRGIAIATITSYQEKASRAPATFIWDAVVDGKSYSSSRFAGVSSDSGGKVFVGRKFPFIYDTTDITNNYLLVFPDDFKKFDINFPDSLKWVIPYAE